MTEAEFKAWAAKMARDAGHWTVDPIHNGADRDDLIIYCGNPRDPSCGIHVSVLPEMDPKHPGRRLGTYRLTTGRYEGAVPHIGEACFQITRSVAGFPTLDAALRHATERLGLAFLSAITLRRRYRTAA